ncbi:predicted protein [Coccidioides posadasii str. Silveira]|uniref:Predicted protein n=1 Tax=Coccidioides posadasii (strain RMSCC 757 / Silveira) TaxID=443226 RepID=E9CUG5_COCPS|nr:predicted protein [Coccidioides posadasii str. Silveira]
MFVECAMHSAAQGDYRGQPISRARNPGIRLAVAGDWLALSIQLLNTNQQDNSSSSQRTFVQVSNLFVLSWAEIIFPSPDPHPTPKATLARPPYPARSLTGWAVAWTVWSLATLCATRHPPAPSGQGGTFCFSPLSCSQPLQMCSNSMPADPKCMAICRANQQCSLTYGFHSKAQRPPCCPQ